MSQFNNPYILSETNRTRIWEVVVTCHSDQPGQLGLKNRIDRLEPKIIKMKETDKGLFSTEDFSWKMKKKTNIKFMSIWLNGDFLVAAPYYPSSYLKNETLMCVAGNLSFALNNINAVRRLILQGLGEPVG